MCLMKNLFEMLFHSDPLVNKHISVASMLRLSLTLVVIRHMMTHTGEKPHQCSQYGKAFPKASTLKRHMRTHTSEKPYQCTHCEKVFSQTSNLNTHMMTHTGERPHQCSQCDKTSSSTSDLRKT